MFVKKLYNVLSESQNSDCIQWSNEGFSFTIHNLDIFIDRILKVRFGCKKFTNFQRLLNMYGFRKVNNTSLNSENNKEEWIYYHPNFIRGKKHLIKGIKRKGSNNKP
ncbi:hypothetical protein PIROE2DRAFT_37666, partial [Piromyces sp. E2]